ncbi:PLP-dependent aminotransferase family protein [Lacticaseibacillus hulanensis]|uniref:aminotransferase-like domain-containing protein n=1 Tax=Lacticaseibacillus hulanensis TaxID=2493111 RepID=UPI0013E3F94F|nr:PLP-dependent aminotransferase family protein [Lacticaseibacillus hulanensis]
MQLAERITTSKDAGLGNLLAAPKKNQVSFAGGLPDPLLFPQAELNAGFNRALAGTAAALQYASAAGYAPLRNQLATRLRQDGVPACTDSVLITQGAQQALDLIGRLTLDAGARVIVEGPTYPGALAALGTYQPKFCTVPVQEDGMDMAQLATTLARGGVRLIYTVPDFQNPTGTVMSLQKRQQLLALARKYDVLVLEDAPYRALRYRGTNLPTLRELDQDDRVLHVGSFSKILAPGLRLGWVTGAQDIIDRLVQLKSNSDLESSTLTQRAVSDYLANNDLDAHIKTLRRIYARKCTAMVATLQKHLPASVHVSNPDGGFFVWVELPPELNAEEILARVKDEVTFVPSTTLYPDQNVKNGMRIAFTNPDVAAIRRGCVKLAHGICAEIENAEGNYRVASTM